MFSFWQKNLKVTNCPGVCSQRRLQYAGWLVYQFVIVGSTSMRNCMLIKYLTDWSDALSNILCAILTDGSGVCTMACVDSATVHPVDVCQSAMSRIKLATVDFIRSHWTVWCGQNRSHIIPKFLVCCLLVHGKCVKCIIGLSFITGNDLSFWSNMIMVVDGSFHAKCLRVSLECSFLCCPALSFCLVVNMTAVIKTPDQMTSQVFTFRLLSAFASMHC